MLVQFLKILLLVLFFNGLAFSQTAFFLSEYWHVQVFSGGIYNIETADINRDNHLDIIAGNLNSTLVWFGGKTLLDSTIDLTYKGRCLAITDYNGDGIKDLITMHYTRFDSVRDDYDGDILFYYGKAAGQYLFDSTANYSIPLPLEYPEHYGFGLGNMKPGVRCGDLNGDGKMDIVISQIPSNSFLGKIFIYMGRVIPIENPDYTLSSIIFSGHLFAQFFETGDINGDHYDDLLISQAILNPSHTYDSLAILYIFYGGQNQNFDLNNPSILYKSRIAHNIGYADWFNYLFSLDDINCDGIKDLVISRQFYKPDSSTTVHYGRPGINGFDTVANIRLKTPDPTDPSIIGRGISQNIGDFNSDGYNDFILFGGGYAFWLILGGPHISNQNPYGIRGYFEGGDVFPPKALPMDDQSGLNRSSFITMVRTGEGRRGQIFMFIGDPYIHTDITGETKSTEDRNGISLEVYPNPFNSETVIKYTLPISGHIKAKLYNSLGQEITTLITAEQNAGIHEIRFKSDNLPSGIYFIKTDYKGKTAVKKIILLK